MLWWTSFFSFELVNLVEWLEIYFDKPLYVFSQSMSVRTLVFDRHFNKYSYQPSLYICCTSMWWYPNLVLDQLSNIKYVNSSYVSRWGLSNTKWIWCRMELLPSITTNDFNLCPYLLYEFLNIFWFNLFRKCLVFCDERMLSIGKPLICCFCVSVKDVGFSNLIVYKNCSISFFIWYFLSIITLKQISDYLLIIC